MLRHQHVLLDNINRYAQALEFGLFCSIYIPKVCTPILFLSFFLIFNYIILLHPVKKNLGRKRYLPGILSLKRKEKEFVERTAVNTPVQGAAADLIKLAMVNLERRFKEEGLGAYIILQIHDELLFEIPEREMDKTRKIVKEEMEGAIKLSVPLVVDTRVGKNWAEMRG
ncbi:MAG: DNA polymerase [Candidatus Aerophobetes bacterium]|nr:DNA polymerase [Candidatus Aerophobetes bacterium]